MAIMPGTHELGARNAALKIKTERRGAAAMAGHDLVIEVTSWEATLQVGSTAVEALDGGRLRVSGELTMNGNTHPLDFVLEVGPGGQVSGQATVTQSEWGIEPYSGLFGTLKVRDEVEVVAEGSLPQ